MKKPNRRTLESAGINVIHTIKDGLTKKVIAYYCDIELEPLAIAAYQRGLTKAVERIEREYEGQALGALRVSYRPTQQGDFWLWDGYQRTTALMNMGYTHAKAEISVGLSYQDEARLFFNVNDTPAKMGGWVRFKAAYTAGNDVYRGLIKTARKAGLTTPLCQGVKKAKDADIKSPQMLLEPFNRGGMKLLRMQCRVLNKCWKKQGHLDDLAKRIEMTRGLATFLKAFAMGGDALPTQVINAVLGSVTPAGLLNLAKKEETNRADSRQYYDALCRMFGTSNDSISPDGHLKAA